MLDRDDGQSTAYWHTGFQSAVTSGSFQGTKCMSGQNAQLNTLLDLPLVLRIESGNPPLLPRLCIVLLPPASSSGTSLPPTLPKPHSHRGRLGGSIGWVFDS